jgi:PadR family transcriptional regulator, regulatory protein PadR
VRRPSPQAVAVLTALAADATAWRYGYELGQEVGLKAGSLYPILIRLSDRGLLESTWEQNPPAGRPHRHLYRLSPAGIQLTGEIDAAATLVCARTAPRPTGIPQVAG